MIKPRTIAKCGKMRLKQYPGKLVMTGGKYGPHYVREADYTERANLHWQGYIANNGVKWQGHIEYFPNGF